MRSIALAVTLAITSFCYSQTPNDIKIVRESVREADKLFNDNGLHGIINKSKTMMIDPSTKKDRTLMLKFLATDMFGFFVEYGRSKSLKTDLNPYFAQNVIFPRWISVLNDNNITGENEVRSFIDSASIIVQNEMTAIAAK